MKDHVSLMLDSFNKDTFEHPFAFFSASFQATVFNSI